MAKKKKKSPSATRPTLIPRPAVAEQVEPIVAGRHRPGAHQAWFPFLLSHALKRVDIASLVIFRICFGLIMFWEVCRYLYYGWIKTHWLDPKFHFTFLGFDWVQPWPGNGVYLHFYVLGALALCIAAGLWYRVATILFFPAFAYVLLLDKAYFLNHFYLITLLSFLLIFVPAHRAFSLDARWKPEIRSDTTPAWTVWILSGQLAIAYFYGGVAKLQYDWLILGEPMRSFLWMARDFPFLGIFFTNESVVYFFAWGGTLFDLAIPFLLWWPRTRMLAYIAAVLFHLTNVKLFQIGIFPWFMICASTLFFAPGWPREIGLLPRIQPKKGRRDDDLPDWREKAVLGGLAVYFFFQLIVPLRHYLYPGNVLWNRQGGNFSWHMRISVNAAKVQLFVTDLATGEGAEMDPSIHLNLRQIQMMPTDPDMLLHYAHFLAEEGARNGYENIDIRAKTSHSVNRRPPRVFIDPEVNLVTQERSIWPVTFVLPFDEAPLAEPPPGKTSTAGKLPSNE